MVHFRSQLPERIARVEDNLGDVIIKKYKGYIQWHFTTDTL